MSHVVLGLGDLEHIHSSQNLKLQTNVTLSLSQMSPYSIPMLDSADLETLISTGTWIAGGNRLQINVRFIFVDIEIIPHCGNASVVEQIGVRMCNAEIWSQLGLDATYNLAGHDAEGSDLPNQLVLTLTGRTTSHTTVKAPGSVPSACLESVSLLFNFSTCRRIRVPSNIQEQSTALVKEAARTASLHLYDADALGIPQCPPRPEQQWSRVDADFHDQEQDHAIGSPSRWQLNPPIASQPSPFPVSNPNSQEINSPIHSWSSGRELSHSSSPGLKHATQKANFGHLFGILDASLRLTICNRKAPKSEDVILSKDSGFPRLVKISPAVFSPHFLEAVSQRNSLLPIIAHAIGRVYRRTRSGNLQRKLERLLATSPNGNLAHDKAKSDDSQLNRAALPVTVQAHLWCLMQHKLLDPRAWLRRKFEILGSPRTTCGREFGSHILDDPLIDRNIEKYWNDEDVDLLSEGTYPSGVNNVIFDKSEKTKAQYSNNDPITTRDALVEDDVAGEDLFCPERKAASDDRSTEEALIYGQTLDPEGDDDMDEDLFRSERNMQEPHQETYEDMTNGISSAGQDAIHYSQGSYEGFARYEIPNFWEEDHEEMLDGEQAILNKHQVTPKYYVQREPWNEDPKEMLDDGHNGLDDGFAQFFAEDDYQECLDAQQMICHPDQASSEDFVLCTHGQVGHEELLDDALDVFRDNQASSLALPPYMPGEQDYQEEKEIILDPHIATVLGTRLTEELFERDGNDMLDEDRMLFDNSQWNQALIMG